MPARDINFGDVTLHVHGHYISEHSDAEYETMRKAFLRLGKDYDKLQSKFSNQNYAEVRIVMNDTLLIHQYPNPDTAIKIIYCPMCGRKLEEE